MQTDRGQLFFDFFERLLAQVADLHHLVLALLSEFHDRSREDDRNDSSRVDFDGEEGCARHRDARAAFAGVLDRDLSFREFREDHEARDEDHSEDIEGELEAAFDHLARPVVHVVGDPLAPSVRDLGRQAPNATRENDNRDAVS